MTLAMAGMGILSSCDCSKSSFSPKLILLPAKPFASATTLTTSYTDLPISITFNTRMPDTVSCVCGPADGFTKCGLGPRVISFKDKETGELVTFPYRGFDWDAALSVLTLDPAQTSGTCVLTATLQLVNYPAVFYSQDITSTSSTVKEIKDIASTSSAVKVIPLFIASQTLNAVID